MAKILLFWGWDADLIECPAFVAERLGFYQRQFDQWLYDPANAHGCWTTDGEGDPAVCFNEDTFLDWLNRTVLAEESEKARFLRRGFVPNREEKQLPRINF